MEKFGKRHESLTKKDSKAIEPEPKAERPKVSAVPTSSHTGVPLEGHQLRKHLRRADMAAEIQASVKSRKG